MVRYTFFANLIPRLPSFMEILTRNEINFNILIVIGRVISLNKSWIIFRPVNTEESSIWVVSNSFKLVFGSFRCRCEIFPVCLIALVVWEKLLTQLTFFFCYNHHDILNISGVVSDFSIKVILYCESELEPHFMQVHLVLRIYDCLLSDLGECRVGPFDKVEEFQTSIGQKDANDHEGD